MDTNVHGMRRSVRLRPHTTDQNELRTVSLAYFP